jgi:hypothetical protein
MDAKLKADWVKALRSGEYRQGRGEFEGARGFCCLGVLCKVANEPTVIDAVGNWAFPEKHLPKNETWVLAGMNDSGASFYQIATYIEQNL